MDDRIRVSKEYKRGCGYRKEGGIYLVSSGIQATCGKLPFPLNVCPTCHCGVKPARGFTWINANELFGSVMCCNEVIQCMYCPLFSLGLEGATKEQFDKAGLIWIGKRFYPTPADFLEEARIMGVSRRITPVPKDFEVGKTWVFLAHRKAIEKWEDASDEWESPGLVSARKVQFVPGIVYVFRPQRIEYVVKGDETPEEIDSIVKRGMTPVKVERIGEQKEMFHALREERSDNSPSYPAYREVSNGMPLE